MNSKLLPFASIALIAFSGFAAEPALTIYNQNFAVVRDTVPLDLKAGVNDVTFSNTTMHLEPNSVILRDPAGKLKLQILEQNYRNDPVSQELLLSLFEGKTIDFFIHEPNKPDQTVKGKIIRSGYVPHSQEAMQRYGQQYAASQMAMAYGGGSYGGSNQPVIEVDGKIQFGLPGQPIFPSLGDDTILKPMISWKLETDKPGKTDAELCYVTGGMTWEADYNVVAAEKSDTLDLVGWVTMDNQSGKTFDNARIKLMAGDVNKIQDQQGTMQFAAYGSLRSGGAATPPVTEKAFDEYHLYTLKNPTTLRDRETKQVEFIRATGIKSEKLFVYDGLKVDWNRWRGYSDFRRNEEFGVDSDTKVAVMREFKNSEENHLGIPLPKGRVRFYKQDDDKQHEFTGENTIDHTPKDETIRVTTGNAFDLAGERRRKDFKVDSANHSADESFEIKVRNHKNEQVEVRVVEHLYRWYNWEITAKSDTFLKTNAQEIEFRVQIKPDEEKVITYKVHYSW